MKRISIGVLLGVILSVLLMYPIGNSKWLPAGVRAGYFLLWGILFFIYIFGYRKMLDKRLIRLENALGKRCLRIYTASYFDEFYLLDTENFRLYGLIGSHPFGVQMIDAGEIDDAEIIVRGRNEYVLDAVICRLHLQGKRYDIYLHRFSRRTVYADSGEGRELMSYAETVRESLTEASRLSRGRAGREGTAVQQKQKNR